MQHILYLENAKQLSVNNSCLLIKDSNDQENTIHCDDILAIVIENIYCQITIPAMLLCVESKIPLLVCDHKHQPAIYCLDFYTHSELRKQITEQINWPIEKQYLAWLTIIRYKLDNQLMVLRLFSPHHLAINKITEYRQKLDQVNLVAEQINTIESISARLYFNALFGDEFKRFELDGINAALNYGYSIVRSVILLAITGRGLHPTLGIWHHSVRNRFNLADDLIEILRPLVDQTVKKMMLDNQQQFTRNHRQQLLSILHHPVLWQQKMVSLKNAIDHYLNDFVRFMGSECDIISPIIWSNVEYGTD
ncbi:type II CRISPR-associated endonuclease Cas1 [Orbus wheelerorum]|uniref:type II CRISPR-associated endonuclease Cas1 n=1 Tax=Orbus wheelerorum TaxID=3074111 RepID=UPI00370D45E8